MRTKHISAIAIISLIIGAGGGWTLGSMHQGAIAQTNRLSAAMADLTWQQRQMEEVDSPEARTHLLDRMNGTVVLLGNSLQVANIGDELRSSILAQLRGEADRRKRNPPEYIEGIYVHELIRQHAEAILASCTEG